MTVGRNDTTFNVIINWTAGAQVYATVSPGREMFPLSNCQVSQNAVFLITCFE